MIIKQIRSVSIPNEFDGFFSGQTLKSFYHLHGTVRVKKCELELYRDSLKRVVTVKEFYESQTCFNCRHLSI